jgi:phage/plasmid-associated DNA primase
MDTAACSTTKLDKYMSLKKKIFNPFEIVRDAIEDGGHKALDVYRDRYANLTIRKNLAGVGITLTESQVWDAFTYWAEQQKAQEKLDILSFTGTTTAHQHWIDAVAKDADLVVARAVMDHWVWSIKRKIAGIRVDHHIMPILIGTQGCGKSTLVKLMLDHIPGWAKTSCKLTDITDERSSSAVAEYYVAIFDEMQDAARADIEGIKSFVTADSISYRPMRSNARAEQRMCASLIGTSNRCVSDLIVDTTGMRRFFELEVKDVLDWNYINNYDFRAWFDSIDYRSASPILAVLGALREAQSSLVGDTIGEWLKAGHNTSSMDGKYKSSELYADYAGWCKLNAPRGKVDNKKFSSMLKNKGWEKIRRRDAIYWGAPDDIVAGAENNTCGILPTPVYAEPVVHAQVKYQLTTWRDTEEEIGTEVYSTNTEYEQDSLLEEID